MSELLFMGPAGRIEARYHPSATQGAPVALILHPNPQLGGTMNNKVVYTLYQAFVKLGFSVMRFNFRGVGKSQGVFDGDPNNEMADTLAALDWLKKLNPEAFNCWIAGYSFGAWIGCQILMRRPDVNGFVAVSPPANVCDFSFLSPCPASGLIVQGTADTVVSPADSRALAERLDGCRRVKVNYIEIPQADHLYEGYLKNVYDAVVSHVPDLLVSHAKRKDRQKKKVAASVPTSS